MVTINSSEGPAYGAALLAAVGAGFHDTVEEACRSAIRIVERTEPMSDHVALYADYYGIYRDLYPALKPSFDRVTEIVTQRKSW